MNKPLVGNQVKKLPIGYHITRQQMGIDPEHGPVFYPNRRMRRLRNTNRNKILQQLVMKIAEDSYVYQIGDQELRRVNGRNKHGEVVFLIIKRKIFHSKSAFK